MTKSKAYSAVNVQRIVVDRWLQERAGQGCRVGVDVGKQELVMVVRWQDGSFERPVRVVNPGQIPMAVSCLKALSERGPLVVAMESSGTYGDPFREALGNAGLGVLRISGKASHDYAEVFDGVPSQHDGKDAAILAELAATGKGRAWGSRTTDVRQQQLELHVDLLDMHQQEWLAWCNRLESWLGRHWPELTQWLELGSATMLKVLGVYGGPSGLGADAKAAQRLRRWGGPFLTWEKIAAIVEGSRRTLGVSATEVDQQRARAYARQAWVARAQVNRQRRELPRWSAGMADVEQMAMIVGLATACVLHVAAGDPGTYSCGRAYVKALGLNLAERSSGRWVGGKHLSKRGPASARRWLYLAALRTVRQEGVRQWYVRKVARDNGKKRLALTAVMRKLATAIYRCRVSGQPFDSRRLFPGRPVNATGVVREKGATTALA